LQEIESIKQEQLLYRQKEQEIQAKEAQIASVLHQSDRLKREKNAKVAQYKKSSAVLKTQYTTQKDELTTQRDVYENMIKTQEGSFKEFLQENVELWEEKLYPVLDAELLDMPQTVLKPKLNAQDVLNLDIDTTTLKKILPYDEALNRIKQINQELSTLSSVYKERLYSQKLSYKESLLELKYKQESIFEQINSLKEAIANIDKQYQNALEELKDDLATFKAGIDEKIDEANKSILALQEQTATNRAKIKNLQKEIQAKKQEFARYKEEQKRTLVNQKERTKQELSKEFVTKKEEIQAQIQEYKNKQSQISNDERIQKLLQEQETLRV
jgi:chromosome segregation ATPase